ncbi:hypothetical protein EHI46_24715 [Rhizobium leguminosarum]|jgi:hypothetical protein|nr:hypothetical protein EHI46_24715 [Rhizobium leguminosarum]
MPTVRRFVKQLERSAQMQTDIVGRRCMKERKLALIAKPRLKQLWLKRDFTSAARWARPNAPAASQYLPFGWRDR